MSMEQMNYEKIGAFIAERRKAKEMTQLQLAELLGVTDRAVSKWERAKSIPDVSLLKPLCEALGISIGEFWEGKIHEQGDFTKEEANDAIIKGLGIYSALLKRKATYFVYGIIIVLALAALTLLLWPTPPVKPVDFGAGNYAVETISVGENSHFEGVGVDSESARQLKTILNEVGNLKEEKVSLTDPQVKIEGIGVFSENGYRDYNTNKTYTFAGSDRVFIKLYNIGRGCLDDLHYTIETYQLPSYPADRKLSLKAELVEKPQEQIIGYYIEMLSEKDKAHPKAYIKSIDVLSVERLTEEKYKDIDCFGDILKTLADKDIYEYRIYSCVTDMTYTEEMRSLGRQNPEGKRKQFFLIGKSGDAEDGFYDTEYDLYYISQPVFLN